MPPKTRGVQVEWKRGDASTSGLSYCLISVNAEEAARIIDNTGPSATELRTPLVDTEYGVRVGDTFAHMRAVEQALARRPGKGPMLLNCFRNVDGPVICRFGASRITYEFATVPRHRAERVDSAPLRPDPQLVRTLSEHEGEQRVSRAAIQHWAMFLEEDEENAAAAQGRR